MTKSQQYTPPVPALVRWRAPGPGELVAGSRLWLTRQGDLDDHVLQPGERMRLNRGDDLVIEALREAGRPLWRWQPASRPATGWWTWMGRARTPNPPLRADSCQHA